MYPNRVDIFGDGEVILEGIYDDEFGWAKKIHQ